MKVFGRSGGVVQTNAFVIGDEETKEAALFDAPDHTVGALLDEAERAGFRVGSLYFTHGHFDHVADHEVFSGRFPGAPLVMHRADEFMLEHPERIPFPLPFKIGARKGTGYVEEGEVVRVGRLEFRVMWTPGHSPGHVGYYLETEDLLVSGDLIIQGSVGRTDLPYCNAKDLDASLLRVAGLPGKTRLLPGHGAPSTVGEELLSNEYLARVVRRGRG